MLQFLRIPSVAILTFLVGTATLGVTLRADMVPVTGGNSSSGSGESGGSGGGSGKALRCGNNVIESPEQCDDGNFEQFDDCTSMCQKARCGDGMVQPGRNEECDQGEVNGASGHCTKECKKPTSPVKEVYCGNGTVETNEECDDGNYDNSDDCSISCRKAYCGDGILQHNEECDLGRSNGMNMCSAECKKNNKGEQGGINVEIINLPPAPSSISNQGQSTTSTTAIEFENNFLKMQMEEARKRAEEEERRLQEGLRMERERREKESASGFLGCFDGQGQWVRSRELCDFNQKQQIQVRTIEVNEGRMQTVAPVPMQTIPENKVQEEIRKNLLGDDIAEQQRVQLLAVLENAKQRITTLTGEQFAPEVNAYLTSAIGWIDQGIQYFASGPRTAEEVRMMNEPIRTLMSQVNELIASQKQLPKEMPRIDPIIEKTEALLNKFRNAFVALAQNGIGLDQNALQGYIEAAERFSKVKDACVQHGNDCGAINEVLEKLKEARPWLEDQLTAHPEIVKKSGL